MSYGSQKTEHAGAKNGGGFWGKRDDAKRYSKKKRRAADRAAVRLAAALVLAPSLALGMPPDIDTDKDARVVPLRGGTYSLPPGYFFTRKAYANVDEAMKSLQTENAELKASQTLSPVAAIVLSVVGTALTAYFGRAALEAGAR